MIFKRMICMNWQANHFVMRTLNRLLLLNDVYVICVATLYVFIPVIGLNPENLVLLIFSVQCRKQIT